MTYRVTSLATGEICHIFNRGVEKRNVFVQEGDYKRFIDTMVYYQTSGIKPRFSLKSKRLVNDKQNSSQNRLVDIICFCLMPNHFHLLLRQVSDKGVADFVGRLTNSYTRYFNVLHDRVGHLFQGPYKAVKVDSDEQLLHISRYIHLNPLVGELVKELNLYRWSSYHEYIRLESEGICNVNNVLGYFHDPKGANYQKFVLDQVEYAKSLEFIKHLTTD